jgi:UDP-N-acetyl-D-galactosamine dehydrogenase
MNQNNIYPCIIGLGYVGLPILMRLSKKFNVTGYDLNKDRINFLKKGIDINNEIKKKDINKKIKKFLTFDINNCKKSNFYILCIPTPITKNKKPDLRKLIYACKNLSRILKKNDIIFIESTVYPGVTNKVCEKVLSEKSGLIPNKEFFIGYSPERINPGDKVNTIENISKIVAFPYLKKKKIILKVYKEISKKIYFTKNIEEAEVAKCVENIQRDLNIGLINEIFLVCKKMKINFNEVINLASTKWNFIKYKPGLVGGHCLPVDPYYFSYVAKKNNINTNILLAGRRTNEKMKNEIIKDLKMYIKKKFIKFPSIVFAGLTYKNDVADLRNSLSMKIYNYFKKNYKNVQGYDPIIHSDIAKKIGIKNSINKLKKFNLFVVLTKHKIINEDAKKIKVNIYDYFNQ